MTIGQLRATRNLARILEVPSQSYLEAGLLIQRSPEGPDLIAAMVRDDLDAAEIARIAQRVIAGDKRSRDVFLDLDQRLLSSMCRVLCLTGDDEAFDRGLVILQAQNSISALAEGRPLYRALFIEALIQRRRFAEAAEYAKVARFSRDRLRQFRLAFQNPFRDANSEAIEESDWINRFNEFVSPSGELSAISLEADVGRLPFDRLKAEPPHIVEGPLVTVVMSSFRNNDSVIGAVTSILNQTWRSLELLVIDDDSGPGYDELYDRISSIDSRIRVIRQRINGGTYLARNRAITLARGEFITFQDSDDWSHPERIERQIRPLLETRSLIATQSYCFRTDEYLDPVQVSYPRQLRRNESSLLFRTNAIRRAGFFHYTRKGGDTEYRFRLEAAYRQQTPIVGEEPLAIVRLTPGSLSRNEFSPGFRHPRRMIYAQGFEVLHKRAEEDRDYYRGLHEYRDAFVPSKFQPRLVDTISEKFDVIVVADLRTCAQMEAWIISTVDRLHGAGLQVGLAQLTGTRKLGRPVDRIAPEVSELFVDRKASPVDFGERRRASSVFVGDVALLQHMPWGAKFWNVDHVYARQLSTDASGSEPYDETTVSFNCLRLFGERPEWVADSDNRVISTIVGYSDRSVLELDGGPSEPIDMEYESTPQLDSPARAKSKWWFEVDSLKASTPGKALDEFIVFSNDLSGSFARVVSSGQWCVVVGRSVIGFELQADYISLARELLTALTRGDEVFEAAYRDIGGECVVVCGDSEMVSVRATAGETAVRTNGNRLHISVTDCGGTGPELLTGNREQFEISTGGSVSKGLVSQSRQFGRAALEEFQQIIIWEVDALNRMSRGLVLDDDFDSAFCLALLKDRIGRFEITVRDGEGKIAQFLRSHFVDFRTAPLTRDQNTAIFDYDGNPSSPNSGPCLKLWRAQYFGTSVRARNLLGEIFQSMDDNDVLDALWAGLSAEPTFARRSASLKPSPTGLVHNLRLAESGAHARRPKRPLAIDVTRSQLQRIQVSPDLSEHEQFALNGYFWRGNTRRLVVVMSSARSEGSNETAIDRDEIIVDADHILILSDSTFSDSAGLDYGWFFGAPGDNIVRRWSVHVQHIYEVLGCSEIVIRGSGSAALPALLMASFVPGSTALISKPEKFAGESDPAMFERLCDAIDNGYTPDLLRSIFSDRLHLRGVLHAASAEMRIVLTDKNSMMQTDASTEMFSEWRNIVAVDSTSLQWLESHASTD